MGLGWVCARVGVSMRPKRKAGARVGSGARAGHSSPSVGQHLSTHSSVLLPRVNHRSSTSPRTCPSLSYLCGLVWFSVG